MLTTLASADRTASAARTLDLLRFAARCFQDQPSLAAAWLHGPHPLLLGAIPAEAAWFSGRLACYAALLLAEEAALAQLPGAIDRRSLSL